MLTTRSPEVIARFKSMPARQMEVRENQRRRVEPYKPAWEVLPDAAWAGQPAFLIGGGPSLIGFDFERLRGRGRIIAINRAVEFVPFADILFFMDWKLYLVYHNPLDPEKSRAWNEFKGLKIFLNLIGRKVEDCYSLRSLGRRGSSDSLKAGFYHGNNSGLGALQLAMALHARPIYLLGYDMKHSGGRSHFHSGYEAVQAERVVQHFINDFQAFSESPKSRNRGIVNLNPDSALRAFPFSTIDEVLNGPTGESLGYDDGRIPESVLLGSPAPD
jgi:hypothetical protein